MALLKDGWNFHERCNGKGCYRCHNTGYLILCPVCANSEPEFFTQDEGEITCRVCGFTFDKSGKVLFEQDKT